MIPDSSDQHHSATIVLQKKQSNRFSLFCSYLMALFHSFTACFLKAPTKLSFHDSHESSLCWAKHKSNHWLAFPEMNAHVISYFVSLSAINFVDMHTRMHSTNNLHWNCRQRCPGLQICGEFCLMPELWRVLAAAVAPAFATKSIIERAYSIRLMHLPLHKNGSAFAPYWRFASPRLQTSRKIFIHYLFVIPQRPLEKGVLYGGGQIYNVSSSVIRLNMVRSDWSTALVRRPFQFLDVRLKKEDAWETCELERRIRSFNGFLTFTVSLVMTSSRRWLALWEWIWFN